ncbi:MAG: glycoside hydrolase family 32 protein, partial [Lachnospiraceae bacterium]|nr:glycoside hydrolase family 32 protein [Lachnospiraceae bacterium]
MTGDILSIVRGYEQAESPRISPDTRPLFHVTPLIGWMNDPNGFSVYKGEYHLFYQYYPFDTVWGPMHWGHVKSKDLIRWEYLPCAMAPDSDCDREGCWSGGALESADGRHLLLYTGRMPVNRDDGGEHILQVQCLAFGDGVDYDKCSENPVISEAGLPEGGSRFDFRDPKIWWDERENAYLALIGNLAPDGAGQLLLFRSADALHWQFLNVLDACRNEYGRMWECPDFFEIGDEAFILVSPQEMAYGGEFQNRHGNMYISGTYDPAAHTFARKEVHAIDFGYDFYAAQTLLAPDGRRIMIAWMQAWENSFKTMGGDPKGWRGMMTLPRELTVKDGRLIQNPIRELEAYRQNPIVIKDYRLAGEAELPGISGRVLDMAVTVKAPEGAGLGRFEMRLAADAGHRTTFAYDAESGLVTYDRTASGFEGDSLPVRRLELEPNLTELTLRVILDRFSSEIFLNGGERTLTSVIHTPLDVAGISFFAEGEVLLDIEKYDLVF